MKELKLTPKQARRLKAGVGKLHAVVGSTAIESGGELVVLLFDLPNTPERPLPKGHEHEYVFVGDAGGGTYIRGVTKRYPAEDEAQGIDSPLLAAMDDWDKYRHPGEGCTNTVPATDKLPKPARPVIYIAVRGGVVQGVRYEQDGKPAQPEVVLVDYDNYDTGGTVYADEEDFEKEQLDGRTWDDLEKTSMGVL